MIMSEGFKITQLICELIYSIAFKARLARIGGPYSPKTAPAPVALSQILVASLCHMTNEIIACKLILTRKDKRSI